MTRILIVDDNRNNLYMLRALLQGHGYAVEEARHGAEALTVARQNPPDLIISDLLMPVMDGYTLPRHWKTDDRLNSIPFIVYTATYTEPRDERLARSLGADEFLVKPAEPEPFMTCVRDTLAKGLRRSLPGTEAPEETVLLKEYNAVLVRKLEKKAQDLEQSIRELHTEIAERKRTEAELRDSEERFRVTFEQAAVGIAHVDIDGRFLCVNDRFCEITGYPRDEILQRTFMDLTMPEDRSAADEARLAMLSHTRDVYATEKRYLRMDGSIVWVNLVTTPMRDGAGTPRYFITIIMDVTARKQSEEALRLRDRAIQSVSQGILIADARQPDNPIVYASAGFERMTGYRMDEALGKNCRFLQGRDTNRDTVAKLREAIAAGRPCSVEILNYRKDGTAFWNALSLNPVHDDGGSVSYFVGVQNDLTDRKKLEVQLQQSQKMEAIGQLAGGVAHDFNNLLTIISGYSALLLSTPAVDSTVRESVEAIREAGERAATLTRQLLGFSRQAMLQPKVLNLNAVVTETATMLRRLIGEDIHLTTVLDPHLGPVKVDPGQLDQVLMNLAINARDAMPRGGKLTIETANVMLDDNYVATHTGCRTGHHVMLAMTDTGCGMTPDVMARVFEPFFTTKEVGKGTGLGLAMVFGIVQQSGGFIRVYSEPSHGTTFKIYLPAVGEPYTIPRELTAGPVARGTETILLVEDDGGVRGLGSISLKSQGYNVLTAVDGEDALRVAHEHNGTVDLILSDVVMPKLGGPELVRVLKARFPHLKILYMSGYTDDAVVRHGLLEAGLPFIQKPYSPRQLAWKVRKVLDESGEMHNPPQALS